MLRLQIKQPYFEQIAKGEKVEEIRENTYYNFAKFVTNIDSEPEIIQHKEILFVNGYKKDAPEMVCRIANIEYLVYLDENGNETDEYFFKIHIAEVLTIKNYAKFYNKSDVTQA